MYITPLRLVSIGLVGTAAYATYEVRRLRRLYPWHSVSYEGPIAALILPDMVQPGQVTTRIPNPPQAALSAPIDTYLSAFYSTWTLRLEALMSRLANHIVNVPRPLPKTGRSFGSGLFQEIYHDENSAAVYWAGSETPRFGGIQVFNTKITDKNELEISFGGAEFVFPMSSWSTKALYEFHYLYAMFLLDRARSRLERWAKEGK